jgi:hypothetical protein
MNSPPPGAMKIPLLTRPGPIPFILFAMIFQSFRSGAISFYFPIFLLPHRCGRETVLLILSRNAAKSPGDSGGRRSRHRSPDRRVRVGVAGGGGGLAILGFGRGGMAVCFPCSWLALAAGCYGLLEKTPGTAYSLRAILQSTPPRQPNRMALLALLILAILAHPPGSGA